MSDTAQTLYDLDHLEHSKPQAPRLKAQEALESRGEIQVVPWPS